LINLDHHISNTNYGDLNLIEDAASTSQVVFNILEANNIKIDKDSIPKVSYEIIGYALNKERFEEDMTGPKTYIETILSTPSNKSVFEFDITIKNYKNLDKHLNITSKHKNRIYSSIFA
jgi:hypothetical protein